MKERLANDQGRATNYGFIGSVKSWTEMRERRLSVLLAKRSYANFLQVWKQTLWKYFFVYSIFMFAARLKGVLRGLKCPWVIFTPCKIESVAG